MCVCVLFSTRAKAFPAGLELLVQEQTAASARPGGPHISDSCVRFCFPSVHEGVPRCGSCPLGLSARWRFSAGAVQAAGALQCL